MPFRNRKDVLVLLKTKQSGGSFTGPSLAKRASREHINQTTTIISRLDFAAADSTVHLRQHVKTLFMM